MREKNLKEYKNKVGITILEKVRKKKNIEDMAVRNGRSRAKFNQRA
jgi:hypothetical protein